MQQYYDEIMRYVKRLTGDKTIAQDLTQETYAKVLEATQASMFNVQKAFLYKVARNLVIDQARKEKRFAYTPYEDELYSNESSNTETILSDTIRQQMLKEGIQNLSPQLKKAFILFYYKGYTRQEIAHIMGISTNAVEKNITRAVSWLKEFMTKDEQ